MGTALIVDDSKFMRSVIKEALKKGGHNVLGEADNGTDGIEMFILLKPDFVTMDITMGGQDGFMAVRAITEKDPSARIIVISALNENVIKSNDSKIKASAFVTKPFNTDQLLGIIDRVIKS